MKTFAGLGVIQRIVLLVLGLRYGVKVTTPVVAIVANKKTMEGNVIAWANFKISET